MDLQLAGKTVVVSGSGQGLGRAIGEAFAAEGARVAFLYRSSSAGAEAAAAAIRTAGGRALAVGADIRDDEAVRTAVATVEDGLGPIDILINNSAVTGTGKFLDTTPQEWARQADVTILGTLRMTQAVVHKMVAHGGGSVVSLMGDSGRVGESGLLVTATTRATTVGLTKSLAKEFARHNIRANAVSIALVQTENFESHLESREEERMNKILSMYPLRRLGRPDDITPAILLLASPLSSWTTGQVLSVNGGYSMPS